MSDGFGPYTMLNSVCDWPTVVPLGSGISSFQNYGKRPIVYAYAKLTHGQNHASVNNHRRHGLIISIKTQETEVDPYAAVEQKLIFKA